MKAFLYILLGLSLGAGLTLIALQERFVRERKRLLAMIDAQRAKCLQDLEELNQRWEQECRHQQEQLQTCQAELAQAADTVHQPAPAPEPEPAAAPEPPPPAEPEKQADPAAHISLEEHERLMQEKNAELSRLAEEMKGTAELLERHRAEVGDLNGQIDFLQGEVTRLQEALQEAQKQKSFPDDDFVMLGKPDGHLIPGSVIRAFIKGRQERSDIS